MKNRTVRRNNKMMKNIKISFIFSANLVLSVLSLSNAHANVRLPRIFGNDMILQRDMPVPVWGWAEKGEKVTVSFSGRKKNTVANEKGEWMVRIDAMKASKISAELKINGDNTITFTNVLVGDVWLCSGQSNMGWPVRRSADAEKEIANANYPEIRHIQIQHVNKGFPQKDVKAAPWRICSPQTAGDFSAIGYYFARTLYKAIDTPIGLISSNWGGTKIEPWICPEGFRIPPELKKLADLIDRGDSTTEVGHKTYSEYIRDLKKWLPQAEAALEANEAMLPYPMPPVDDGTRNKPTKNYNGMIAPLIPFAIRGVIWYQGESNGNETISYFYKKQALIQGWRKLWNQGDFPFYFVQLANFRKDTNNPQGGDGYAGVRDVQKKCLEIPNTGMAVTIDIGDTNNIHPKNKQDVSDRLARWVLADIHGAGITPSGPLFKKHTVENGKIRVFLDYVGKGLMIGEKNGLEPVKEVPNGKLERFAIAGKDQVFYWADAVIDGDTVVISSPQVAEPVAVRYAFSANPLGCNLYNKNGLPASPFRTDDW